MRVASFMVSSPKMLDGFALAFRVSRPELPRHPENCYGWYQREQSKNPGFNRRGGIAMTKWGALAATLGLSLCGASAANAQSMTLTSGDPQEGATIAQ
jgi:hypothetical protein